VWLLTLALLLLLLLLWQHVMSGTAGTTSTCDTLAM
jgi:hypothetical protein